MNRLHKKVIFIIALVIVNIVGLVSCKSKDMYQANEEISQTVDVNNNNAKVLSIKNIDINDGRNQSEESNLSKKVENISDFSVSNILINYEEINNKNNIVAKSQVFLDLTLKPNEATKISFFNDDKIKKINIVSYEYQTLDKEVLVDLKNNTVIINKNNLNLKDSKSYEVLTTSDIYEVKSSDEVDTYGLNIKNTSKKELGNITVKIGQLDEDNEYIMVDSISSYNVLKASEDVKMEIKALEDTKSIELLGYSYDDIKEKANINIDLKLHKASISN